jgi:hypothetical protein
MVGWFQLPPEIRNIIYEQVFAGLVLKPVYRLGSWSINSAFKATLPFASLSVSRQWYVEVRSYLYKTSTFVFTAHPDDPPYAMSPETYAKLRHVVTLETHCYHREWQTKVFPYMVNVRTITIRKIRRLGCIDTSVYHGPGRTQAFEEAVKNDPLGILLCGHPFDHEYVKQVLKAKFPERRIFLEGKIWLADRPGAEYSDWRIDLNTWEVSY